MADQLTGTAQGTLGHQAGQCGEKARVRDGRGYCNPLIPFMGKLSARG